MNILDAQQAKALLADATASGEALAGLTQLERARLAIRARQARGDKPVVPGSFVLPEPRKPIAPQPRRRGPKVEPIKATPAERVSLGPPAIFGTQMAKED